MTSRNQKDLWKEMELITAEFENSENKFVLPIAVKLRGRWLEAVGPAFDEFESPLEQLLFDRRGSRGKLYYLDIDVDVLIYLTEEGSRRSVRISMCKLTPAQCKLIEEAVRQVWVQEGASPRQVEKLLESLDLTITSY